MPQQNMKNLDNIIEIAYLPGMRNLINTTTSPFLTKIKKPMIPSSKFEFASPVGISGGFGFGSEGQATPISGHQEYTKFTATAKDMYTNIEISEKAVALAKGTTDSMFNALKTEIEAATIASKWNVGRTLFGNGTGKLATIKAANSGAVIKVDDYSRLKEGLTVDVLNASGVKQGTARVKAISREKGSDGYYDVTLSSTVTAASGYILTVQNSYNREITGLGAVFDNSVTSLYGLSKAGNPILKPTVLNCNGQISDTIIQRGLREASEVHNSEVDLIMMGHDAFDAYCSYLRDLNIRVEDRTGKMDGGFTAINFLFGNRNVEIVDEQFVPADEAWGVCTKDISLYQTDWAFADRNTGGIFQLLDGQSVYRALMRNYGELAISNPGGCIRFHGCSGNV